MYQKPMLMSKILQLIDKNLDNLKDWGCDITWSKQHCYCKIKTLWVNMFDIII